MANTRTAPGLGSEATIDRRVRWASVARHWAAPGGGGMAPWAVVACPLAVAPSATTSAAALRRLPPTWASLLANARPVDPLLRFSLSRMSDDEPPRSRGATGARPRRTRA